MCSRIAPVMVLFVLLSGFVTAVDADPAVHYGFGRTPAAATIKALDIAIGPRGEELPSGSGTVADGATLYAERCAMCHGASGREGPDPILVGGHGTLTSAEPLLTIGSYWAYATTLYDYISRAMPFFAPGSLAPNEIYALCAYLLNANGIIADDAVMDRETLPAVEMPNRNGFIPDPRPDTGHAGHP